MTTIHEVAHQILDEVARPLSATEIARIALSSGLAASASRDPVSSLANTIHKNIREGKYNTPKLVFIGVGRGRKIGLPSMADRTKPSLDSWNGLVVHSSHAMKTKRQSDKHSKDRALFIRALPRELVTQFKIWCLRRGVTMTQGIKDIIREKVENDG